MQLVTFVLLIFVCVRYVISIKNHQDNGLFVGYKKNIGFSLRSITDQIIDIYSPVSSSFDNDLCRQHSLLFKDGVASNTLWALSMLDASPKIPSGMLTGNMVQLGNYDECLELENIDSDHGRFSGKHCLVTIGDPSFYNAITLRDRFGHGVESLRFPSKQIINGGSKYKDGVPFMGAIWSLCIPSSCTANDLELHLQATLSHVIGNISIRVTDDACNSRADPSQPITAGVCIALALILLIGVLVMFGTAFDLSTSPDVVISRSSKLLLAFSLYTNGKKVLNGAQVPDALPVVDGLRVIAMVWMVVLHSYLLGFYSPTINHNHGQKIATDWLHFVFNQATFCVEIFFLLSGTLVCYNFLKERKKGVQFNLFRYYVHRYIRLTPVYAIILVFYGILNQYLLSGPFAKVNVVAGQQSCRNIGWMGIFYLNNYLDQKQGCLVIDWYLAADMQLFWLSPLLLFPLWRRPKYGKSLLCHLMFTGVILSFENAYAYQLPVTSAFYRHIDNIGMHVQYFHTHTRFTSWLVGVGLGYLLHNTKGNPVRLTRGVVILGWVLSAALLLASLLFGNYLFQPDQQYDRMASSLYYGLSHPAFALGVAWIVFACERGFGGFVNTLLCWNVFSVLSKLCYGVYMTHWSLLLAYTFALSTSSHYFNDIILIVKCAGILVFSFLSSFFLSTMVEMPAVNIERELIGIRKEQQVVENDIKKLK